MKNLPDNFRPGIMGAFICHLIGHAPVKISRKTKVVAGTAVGAKTVTTMEAFQCSRCGDYTITAWNWKD